VQADRSLSATDREPAAVSYIASRASTLLLTRQFNPMKEIRCRHRLLLLFSTPRIVAGIKASHPGQFR
jgi:hypothetical protein